MKYLPPTLSRYLFWQFIFNFLVLLSGLLMVIYIFDTVELLRRAAKVSDLPIRVVLQMGFFKLPDAGQQIFPFAVLFSALFTFWQLTRRSELVVVRAAGLSVWQFMTPLVFAALLIGAIQMAVINPFGAMLIGKYQRLEAERLSLDESLITLSRQGLWLRQKNADGGSVLLHAARLEQPGWVLRDVVALYLSEQNSFVRRVDSRTAKLQDASWVFFDAITNEQGQTPRRDSRLTLDTTLSINKIENSFADPKTVPFWKLPSYIGTMAGTGFNPTPLKIELQALIAKPLFLIGMVLIAACVALRPQRQGGTTALIVAGVVLGFIVFFLTNFLQALGASGQIPIFMAAWFPPVIYCLMGVGGLMILEDG